MENYPKTDAASSAPAEAAEPASEIIKYENHGGLILRDAKARLEAAQTVEEVNRIRAWAEAIAMYARTAKKSELKAEAETIRLYALRRLGQLMAEQKKTVGLNTGTAGKGRPKIGGVSETPPKPDERPTLTEAGIDKNLAKEARKAAPLTDQQIEEKVAALRAGVRPSPKKKKEPVIAQCVVVSSGEVMPASETITDQCVAEVLKTIEHWIGELRRADAPESTFEELFKVVLDEVVYLEERTLPSEEDAETVH
jgi:hypothetical protein